MKKVVAMYFMQTTEDKPALVAIFSDMDKARAYLSKKDKRKYYMREYKLDEVI